jgi:hypothetical protein
VFGVLGVDPPPDPPEPAIAPNTAAPPMTETSPTKLVTGTGVLGSERHAATAAFSGSAQLIACAHAVGAANIIVDATSETLVILAIFIIRSPRGL